MYAPVGGRMRGYEGGGDDEEEEKDERLRPREMLSLSTPINSGPRPFHGAVHHRHDAQSDDER